jgi:hypothetical protein
VPPDLAALAVADHGLVLVCCAEPIGYDARTLGRLADARVLHRVRRGAYVDLERWEGADERERHRLLVLATLQLSRRPAVASHWSAAALLRLDVLGPWPSQVHQTVSDVDGGRSSGLIRRHRGALESDSVTRVDGFEVTVAARTAVDIACEVGFRGGVVVCDSALRSGTADLTALRREVARCTRREGAHSARRAVGFSDGRAESVGESVSRVVLSEVGLPAPDLQTSFYDRRGHVGDSDFWWRAQRTIGEFDGKVKYGRIDPTKDPREIVWAEKKREDRLRGLGNEVARWTWWHLEHPPELRAVVVAAFHRGRR